MKTLVRLSVVLGALVAMAQTDFKKMVAYSSVSHMGFVLVGIGAVDALGISGAMLQMVSHGLIAAAMFFVTGELGWLYFVSSVALGAGFIVYAYRLWRRPGIEGAKPLYLYSLAYLALLFAAMMVDATVLAAV